MYAGQATPPAAMYGQPAPMMYASMREWPTPLCFPNLSCILATCGCGCIPLYQIIMGAAPFKILGTVIPKEPAIAMVIALVLWIGTMHGVGQTAGIVLLIGWILLSIELKNHLAIDENDIVTMLKAFLCPPCHVGQIHEGVNEFGMPRGDMAYGVVKGGPVQGMPISPASQASQAFAQPNPAYSNAPPNMHQMP